MFPRGRRWANSSLGGTEKLGVNPSDYPQEVSDLAQPLLGSVYFSHWEYIAKLISDILT